MLTAVQGMSRWEEREAESCSNLLGLENKAFSSGHKVLILSARYRLGDSALSFS